MCKKGELLRNDAIEKDNFEKHVKDYINTHFQNPITLDTLENIFFVSKSQLSHRFKIAYGISPIRYLINVRLENAKILLEKTDYGITEISQKVGFGNSNYFSDQFRKYRGMSPTEYRKYQRDVFIEKPGGNT